MKLATMRDGTRDGALILVTRDGARWISAREVAPTLQSALEQWDVLLPRLQALADRLERRELAGEPLIVQDLMAPLPRAYEWVDGSAYVSHVVLVRKARGAQPPATLYTDPLIYQGGSGELLAPTDPITLVDEAWGLDFEGEVVAILGDTPRGVAAADALSHVKLLTLANDVTLRELIPTELAKGFGFFQSKPATAFAPFAITPDELGAAWRNGRVHRPLLVDWNGQRVGQAEAGEAMHFGFAELVAHIARTRNFCAGTLLGSGTVANEDEAHGYSCIAERRMRDILATGKPQTRWMRAGDTVRIEMLDAHGQSLFGAIEQTVEQAP